MEGVRYRGSVEILAVYARAQGLLISSDAFTLGRFHVKPRKKSGDRIVSAPLTGGVRAHMRSSAVECRERRSDERFLEGPLPRGGLT